MNTRRSHSLPLQRPDEQVSNKQSCLESDCDGRVARDAHNKKVSTNETTAPALALVAALLSVLAVMMAAPMGFAAEKGSGPDIRKETDRQLKLWYRQPAANWNEALPHGRKPAVASECCWGSLDDAVRTAIVEASLKAFVQAGIGFLPHALQESEVYDLHRPEHGAIPVGKPGFMAFVLQDGTLRPGHDVFNKYAALATKPRSQQ
jgi:hypothetical protein